MSGGQDTASLFVGGGEMGARLRAHDWASSPLGPAAQWPASLKALVRAMLHAKQPMLLWWGPELTQIYNDAFAPSLGPDKQPTALGQGARACWAEVWPVVGAQLEQVIATGTPSWFVDVLVPIFRNGKIEDAWWIYNYSPAFDDDGRIAGVLIICTETTAGVAARAQLERARREAELAREELHGVFMQAPQPIAILTGPEHRFTLANAAYEQLVRRPVLGRTLDEVFSAAEMGESRSRIEDVYRTGEPRIVREAPMGLGAPAEGPDARYLDVTYHPYRGPDGAIRGLMVLINEVTVSVLARKEIERIERDRAGVLEREQALRIAAEAGGRARDEFLAMLGHELRNPLAPIATAIQLMDRVGAPHERERKVIERQVTHLSRLVDDLLDVSRVARGQIQMHRRPIELREVLRKAIEMSGPLVAERNHRFELEIPEHELAVDGDAVRLAQVFANLLTNAAKYTPDGGRIALSATATDAEVVVTVTDSGPGIPPTILPRVFELFVQGMQASDRAQGGLGLGLALVRNFVTLHDGAVTARNRAQGGSELRVTLPRLPANALHPDDSAPLDPTRAPAVAARRILVVDDNEDAADMLAELLGELGHEVRVTHDGPSALAELQAFPAEVGLLDLGLPGMDGFELARRIRATGAGCRLVAVTGYGQAHDRERTTAAGFDRHLTKPIPMHTLVEILASE